MKPFVPVLTYQKIGIIPKRSRLKKQWTTPHALERTLVRLLRKGFTFITPVDLQKALPPKPVLLTFVGGYQSFYTIVFPLLKKYDVHATVFVACDTLGTYNSWQEPHLEPWQNVLTVAQLKEMVQSKLVHVGTLGLTGKNLLLQNAQSARAELEESIYRLQSLHHLKPCAIGFWPGTLHKENVSARELCKDILLPIFTGCYGTNALTEKRFFKTYRLTTWGKFRLFIICYIHKFRFQP